MAMDDQDALHERIAGLSPDRRDLIARLLVPRAPAATVSPAIEPRDRPTPPPLSYAQQRLWFLDQLAGGEPFYNIDYARRFSVAVNFGLLEQAINEVVRRHESLRTTFQVLNGEPVQIVAPVLNIPLTRIDLRELPAMRRESEAVRLAVEEARRPFDLARGPLLRTTLVELGEQDYMLLLTIHHVVCDAWSMMVFAKELIALYVALLQGLPSPLPELPIQYADYAVWQRNWLRGGVLDMQMAYWKRRLAGLSTLRLPADHPRPAVPSYRGRSWYLRLPAALIDAVRGFSQREGVTIFMTLLTAYQILLHRYSGQDDIVVGVPVANRNRPETQGLIGFFVNTLVMRTEVLGSLTVRELLGRVQATAAEAFAHQDLPFESLVEELQPERNMSRNPLYQVSLQVYQHATASVADARMIRDRVHVDKGTASIDLALDVFEVPEGLVARVEYSTDLFSHSTIERMVGHFQTILSGMVADPESSIATLPILTADERRQLLVTWNDTRSEYPREACLHHLVEAQAQRTPEAIAVVSAEGTLPYGELLRRATQLAAHLRGRGVQPNEPVAICVERSLDMVVGLLGILQAGGAYVPLDPAYPRERLAWLLDDVGARLLLTQHRLLDRLPETRATRVILDTVWDEDAAAPAVPRGPDVTSGDLAYVIYTSGSTGQPNGVMIEHRSVCMQLTWMQQTFPLTAADRVVQKYSLAFDASVLEIFWPLSVGARVILAGRDHRVDPTDLLKVLVTHEVTVLDLVPSLLQALVDEGGLRPCRALRRIVCGGEALPPGLPGRLLEQVPVELVNMYGPTETTINASYFRYDAASADQTVPIGRPCGNAQIYILDDLAQPVPPGVPGEIYIGGDGVARGYLNRPELTASRFVPDPFSPDPDARLFRTGDRGRYLGSGEIEFLGRADGQVKVSGFRVETGEIEAVAASHASVRSVHVTARDTAFGSKRLVMYVVLRGEAPEIWPSIGEYFAYDELTYYAMSHDEARNRAYRRAIAGVINGKTVLDLGTGADALWARYCVTEGARRVYAIERLDHAFEQARSLIARLGLEDRIVLLRGDSMTLSLPEQVDVCVSELIGTIGSSEGVVPILNDVRRFLKPGGIMIPHRCVTRIAAVSLPDALRAQPRFTELTRGYVDRIFRSAGYPFDLRVCIKNLPDNAIVSDAATFEVLDFTGPIEREQHNALRLTITRNATIDGFVLWINLYPLPDQFIDVITGEHSWLPVFFPVFFPGLAVQPGDRIEGHASVLDNGTLTPDYRVHGRVVHATGDVTPFDYTSFHRRRAAEPAPFFMALLSAPPAPEAGRPTQRSSGHHLVAVLRHHLRQHLPDYMVPSSIVVLKAFPLTPTGKVDPRGLPDPDHEAGERPLPFVRPRTQLERAIARVWQELLAVSTVGIHDNFFDLGGHSLMIVRLQSRLREQLGVVVSLTDLFQSPTVSSLAAALTRSGAEADSAGAGASVAD